MVATGRMNALVVVGASLDSEGRVVATSAISGSEPYLTLGLDNLKTWRFVPNGQDRAVVAYYFKSDGGCDNNLRTVSQVILDNFVMVTGCVRRISS